MQYADAVVKVGLAVADDIPVCTLQELNCAAGKIRVDEDPVRSVMEVSRAETYVVDERQFRLVEPDIMDDVWNDQLFHSSLVVESGKVDLSG